MANCCLLIETLESFVRGWPNTKGKSEMAFMKFFTREPGVTAFSTNDTPTQFYQHVRCGILHQGETTGGWKISRKSRDPLLGPREKTINANLFQSALKTALDSYKKQLQTSRWDDSIWKNAARKLKAVIKNCK